MTSKKVRRTLGQVNKALTLLWAVQTELDTADVATAAGSLVVAKEALEREARRQERREKAA